MTANAPSSILMLKGPSGFSKTALLNAAARYAKILGIPAAYVDFKDSQLLGQTNVLRMLKVYLGAFLPGFTEPDPWKLTEALHQLSSPALILLDSYEKITETKELVDWIDTRLLAEVEESKQLRFLIGGQKAPERAARWRDLAEEIELDKIDDNQAWKEWLQRKNQHVVDKTIEDFVLGLDGVPATISTALTTYAKKVAPAG